MIRRMPKTETASFVARIAALKTYLGRSELGLSKGQIANLLAFSRVVGPAWLTPVPPMADVRSAISEMRAAAAVLEKRTAATFGGGSAIPRIAEADARVLAEIAVSSPAEWGRLEELPNILDQLVRGCDAALDHLPAQRRAVAHWFLVAQIWEALASGVPAGQPMRMRPSVSEGSAFREICAACYEAITGSSRANPDRAIRAFIKMRAAKNCPERQPPR
jgi:hypothetical protein